MTLDERKKKAQEKILELLKELSLKLDVFQITRSGQHPTIFIDFIDDTPKKEETPIEGEVVK